MEISAIEDKIKMLSLGFGRQPSSSISPENSVVYYSLSDLKNEDKEKLQKERLRYVLDQFELERKDTTFSRDCLFCRKHFTGNRSILLSHLLDQHNFSIGSPDNIVFVNELLDHLEQMLKDLRCFFCEKIFKDWVTLKEHMRKKQHKRINPLNKNYDRFYLINYLELGKTWVDVQAEEDGHRWEEEEDENEEMDCDENEQPSCLCLFCENTLCDFDQAMQHMKEEHRFDFVFLKDNHHLDFYKQLKLINYIRKKVLEKECISCDLKFHSHEDLMKHMMDNGHTLSLPDPERWEQPMYYFSTYDNDGLLCALDDDYPDVQECQVYPEETVGSTPIFSCE